MIPENNDTDLTTDPALYGWATEVLHCGRSSLQGGIIACKLAVSVHVPPSAELVEADRPLRQDFGVSGSRACREAVERSGD